MITSFKDDNYFLSNFYPCPVTYHGLTYPSAEAAFQAQKCIREEDREQFCTMEDPLEAKRLGHTVDLRPDWEIVKMEEMRSIVESKFHQHPDLMAKLLDTGEEYLEEENDLGDKVWGTVGRSGSNLLAQILMQIRDEERVWKAEAGNIIHT